MYVRTYVHFSSGSLGHRASKKQKSEHLHTQLRHVGMWLRHVSRILRRDSKAPQCLGERPGLLETGSDVLGGDDLIGNERLVGRKAGG